MQVVFSCENTQYMWWQAEFLQYTYARVGMRAQLTALIIKTSEQPRRFSCASIQVSNYSYAWGTTPYSPLNKPGGIAEWAASYQGADELVLIVDPDSAFVQHIPEPGALPRGEAFAQEHDYMHTAAPSSQLILSRHCKSQFRASVQPVGIYLLLHRSGLAELARRWLQKAIDIRSDEVCRRVLPDNGWISEMWGYVIAAAELGIRHHVTAFSQATGSNTLTAPIIHYCFPIMKRPDLPWRPDSKDVQWSKWNYKPWDVPSVPRGLSIEGRCLLENLAHFAADQNARLTPAR
jgi:hypothetical protein